jgi:hypothetical protein
MHSLSSAAHGALDAARSSLAAALAADPEFTTLAAGCEVGFLGGRLVFGAG